MSIKTINLGTGPNDRTGDPLRTAFGKANENFAELDLLKAPKDSPTFTGPVSGVTKAMVGLPNADDIPAAQLRDRTTHTGAQAIATVTGLQAALDARLLTAARGSANGVASLDAGGKVPESQLPAIAITDVFTAASQAAMLALTAQRGDIAVRSDLNKTYALAAEPASTLANWIELRTPTDAVLSVAGKTGAVTLTNADVGLGNVPNLTLAQMLANASLTGAPTAPNASQSTRGTRIATMESFTTEFTGGPATGWQRLPSGLILQWGSGNTNAFGYAVVTFPLVFPNTSLMCMGMVTSSTAGYVCTMFGNGQYGAELKTWSAVSTQVSAGYVWIAIGH